jgi:cytochrome P450
VIISKESIANDLLSLRGALYSDRPPLIMPSLITDNGFLGAVRWSDHWRRGRKFAQFMLSPANVSQIVSKQTTEARQMVVDLAKDPSRYAYWLERAGVMASVKQIYGLSEERGAAEERHVHEICSYMEEIDRTAAPGQYLVEFIPALLNLPAWLAPFKREAQKLVDRHWSYLAPLMDHEKRGAAAGRVSEPKSFSRKFFESKQDWELTEREMVWVLSSIYGGGSGTSATAMQSIILNTCLFPEWQSKMQEEIDRVVGTSRLPCFDDVSNMPTVRAVIKESMRWRPVLSGGLSRFPLRRPKTDLITRLPTRRDQGRRLQWILHPKRRGRDPKSVGDLP